jgi:hypothetical protein
MASGEPLAGVKQTLKEKRTSETTALDFVPSWAGQLQFRVTLFFQTTNKPLKQLTEFLDLCRAENLFEHSPVETHLVWVQFAGQFDACRGQCNANAAPVLARRNPFNQCSRLETV